MLRAILLAAVVAGALAGVLVTGLQAIRVVPLILAAETYEQGRRRRLMAMPDTATPRRAKRQATMRAGRPRRRCSARWRRPSPTC